MTTPYEKVVELYAGDSAPDFALLSNLAKNILMETFRGKRNVVLAFYVSDFGSADTQDLCALSDNLDKFTACDTEVLAVSMDSVESHVEFAKKHGIKIPLLSDVDGTVSRLYGALRGDRRFADRILFIVDKTGIIDSVKTGPVVVDDVLKAVSSIPVV